MKRTICLLLLVVACKSAKRVPAEGSGSAVDHAAGSGSAVVVAPDAPAVKDGVDELSDDISDIATRADQIANIKNLDEAKQELAKLKTEREMIATRLAVLQTRTDLREDEKAIADALGISLAEIEKVVGQIEMTIQSANDARDIAAAKQKLEELKKEQKARCAANPTAEGCKD